MTSEIENIFIPEISHHGLLVVRAVVRLVGHNFLLRYERWKLIYIHYHAITSHKLGRRVVQTARVEVTSQHSCFGVEYSQGSRK